MCGEGREEEVQYNQNTKLMADKAKSQKPKEQWKDTGRRLFWGAEVLQVQQVNTN